MNTILTFLGTLYLAFASWQSSSRRDMRGYSAAGLMGTLLVFLVGAIIKRIAPDLIGKWLQMPGPFKLLAPAVLIAGVVSALQYHGLGWRLGELAQRDAPHFVERKNLVGISTVVIVLTTLAFSYLI